MSCENCCQNDISDFRKKLCEFDSRRNLSIFLLNVALNLKNEHFCFYEGSGKSGLPDEVTVFKWWIWNLQKHSGFELFGICSRKFVCVSIGPV